MVSHQWTLGCVHLWLLWELDWEHGVRLGPSSQACVWTQSGAAGPPGRPHWPSEELPRSPQRPRPSVPPGPSASSTQGPRLHVLAAAFPVLFTAAVLGVRWDLRCFPLHFPVTWALSILSCARRSLLSSEEGPLCPWPEFWWSCLGFWLSCRSSFCSLVLTLWRHGLKFPLVPSLPSVSLLVVSFDAWRLFASKQPICLSLVCAFGGTSKKPRLAVLALTVAGGHVAAPYQPPANMGPVSTPWVCPRSTATFSACTHVFHTPMFHTHHWTCTGSRGRPCWASLTLAPSVPTASACVWTEP